MNEKNFWVRIREVFSKPEAKRLVLYILVVVILMGVLGTAKSSLYPRLGMHSYKKIGGKHDFAAEQKTRAILRTVLQIDINQPNMGLTKEQVAELLPLVQDLADRVNLKPGYYDEREQQLLAVLTLEQKVLVEQKILTSDPAAGNNFPFVRERKPEKDYYKRVSQLLQDKLNLPE